MPAPRPRAPLPDLTVRLPDGRERRLPRSGVRTPPLSELLAAAGIPLNTRCRGRGLCQGCLVEVAGETLRACQCRADDLPASIVTVPEASLGDRRLHGVQAFEVCPDAPAPRPREGLGLAIDIGTTTVAICLWDLQSGACLATAAGANEQRAFGDNVLSRIDHAAQAGHSRDLQRALVKDSLAPLLRDVLRRAGRNAAEITEAEAAGNTIMLHTLAGVSLAGFRTWPFHPVFLEEQTFSAAALGFESDFPIRTPPCPGAFVGADITAGALASGMLHETAPGLLIDFGTNGELLLRHGSTLLATATAAGPAFEGGRLRCGATASPGVISSLRRENGGWIPTRVEGYPSPAARGISGAAYIDCLALSRAVGELDAAGRFCGTTLETAPAQDGHPGGRMVRITPDLYVCEADIAELLQAKAAIAAGAMTLLETAGLTPADLGTLYIAGGFGYHLSPAHAMAIGLIPVLPPEKVRVIGNSSLGGASLRLLAGHDAGAREFQQACKVIELNQQPRFEDHFIDALCLAPLEPE